MKLTRFTTRRNAVDFQLREVCITTPERANDGEPAQGRVGRLEIRSHVGALARWVRRADKILSGENGNGLYGLIRRPVD